jgi:hypothetical protein
MDAYNVYYVKYEISLVRIFIYSDQELTFLS